MQFALITVAAFAALAASAPLEERDKALVFTCPSDGPQLPQCCKGENIKGSGIYHGCGGGKNAVQQALSLVDRY